MNFLIFSQEKFSIYFGKWNFFQKKAVIFWEMELYELKKIKKKKKNTLKKFLIFQEMETGLEELTFNETALEETGCLSILY